ncbi:MAG: hypothetical protein AAGI25_02075 [Bacteroidota bacterium]
MKKLLTIAILITGMLFLVSCGDDDEDPPLTFSQPDVSVGSVSDVSNEGTGTIEFTVSLDANLTSDALWTLSSTGDITASIGGATSGTVGSATVTADITAGTAIGAASVTLTVTNPSEDPLSGSGTATAVFSVLAPGDNIITLIALAVNADDDPPTPISVLINDGDGISLPGTVEAINSDFQSDFGITAVDGLASLTVSIDGGTPIDLLTVSGVTDGSGASITSGSTSVTGILIPGSAISSSYTAGGTNVFTFTASDSDGDDASASISVDITEAFGSYSATASTDLQGNTAFDVVGEITNSVTWDAANVYVITGRLIVGNGGTLNIPAGTVIKGETGSGVNAKAIIVAVGGTLNVKGTATAPVIMTSISDALSPSDVAGGDFVGSLAPDVNGLWGGLIVLGDATISASATQVQIEGIPTSVTQGLYGGSDDDDNSGSISYLSLRHGGSNIGAGNEINGITFGGVGSGTTVNWVEVVANQDDGIEWFGGNVNVTNALIWNSGDDSMDTDQDWQGTCDGFIIVTPAGSAFELDGPEGPDARNNGVHTFTNGTVFAGTSIDNLVDWDSPDDGGKGGTNAALTNIYFFGIDAGFYTDGSAIASFRGDGNGISESWEITLTGSDTPTSVLGADAAAITSTVTLNANTVGVTSEVGYEWTFASQANGLFGIGL